ncbi:MAG: ankyrin repeat domain-containing protein, partial [Kiritimatiellia bacterium]|nr:ankyrin repeat domain-containing protein [Kiritimatiellia bacterium]
MMGRWRKISVLAILFISLFAPARSSSADKLSEKTEPEQPLVDAAYWSITNQNTALLKAILCAGLPIDAPLDFAQIGDKSTALHWAVIHNHERVVRFLLANGASVDVRDQTFRRPIDWAIENAHTNLFPLLARPPSKPCVDGIPVEILDYIFHPLRIDIPIFISVNGNEPSAEMIRYCEPYPLIRPISKGIPLKDEPAPYRMRDKETGELGSDWNFRIEQNPDGDYIYYHASDNRPYLHFTLRYGYWVVAPDPVAIGETLRKKPKWKR